MSYFVFVDNSNVWIEGKVASAVAKGFANNTAEAHLNGIEDASWRIDFGKLLGFVTDNHMTEIKKAVLFGSRPPMNDTLWNAANLHFEVVALDRNAANKEKAVDTGIVQAIAKNLYKEASEGDVFILVMGDKDFVPSVKAIRDEKCVARIAFWDNASAELVAEANEQISLTQNIDKITY